MLEKRSAGVGDVLIYLFFHPNSAKAHEANNAYKLHASFFFFSMSSKIQDEINYLPNYHG